jgi:cytochrome c-type biogenesis protein
MNEFLVNQVFDGSILAASLVAIVAGLISFASPCVLPLLPGYLGYVSGAFASKKRMVLGSFLFVLGFAFLFTSYGLLFGALGDAITRNSDLLIRLLGFLTIFFGLIFMFSEKFYRSFKFPFVASTRLISAPILGFMFGLGWTPCIGPTLGAVQTLAFIEASATRGAILSLAYCIGLGAPFIVFALFLDRSAKLRNYLLQRGKRISFIGGAFLILIGLLQVLGIWEMLMAGLRGTISGFIPVI